MRELLYIVNLVLLLTIAYQDFKDRMISLYLMIALGISLSLTTLSGGSLVQLGYSMLVNVAFVAIQGMVLYLYFRYVRNVKNLGTLIGAGDVVFIGLLTLFFSPYWFVLFYVASLSVTIGVSLLARWPQRAKTIPLAGCMAIQMTPLLLLQYFKIYDFYQNIVY